MDEHKYTSIFVRFHDYFYMKYAWLSCAITTLAIAFNLLSIIVLTRPRMVKLKSLFKFIFFLILKSKKIFKGRNPTNIALIGISAANFLGLLTNIPYIAHFYLMHGEKSIHSPDRQRDTKHWTLFLKAHVNSSLTFHTIVTLLTIYLAVDRYFSLRGTYSRISNNRRATTCELSLKRITNCIRFGSSSNYSAIIHTALICLFSILICLPINFYSTVKAGESFDNSTNLTFSYFYLDQTGHKTSIIFKAMLCSQSGIRLTACFCLLIFTSLLINILKQINKRNKSLINSSQRTCKSLENKKRNWTTKEFRLCEFRSNALIFKIDYIKCLAKGEKTSRKRAAMILSLQCSFLVVCELTHSILMILSAFLDSWFYTDVYMPLGDVIDLLTLLNKLSVFALNVLMSSEFRENFFSLFEFKGPIFRV